METHDKRIHLNTLDFGGFVLRTAPAWRCQGNEWDDWVADGKKSPFLGPYVPNDPEAAWIDRLATSGCGFLTYSLRPCKIQERDL